MIAENPTGPRLWVDLVTRLPWLKSRLYFVEPLEAESLADKLAEFGFRVVRANWGRREDEGAEETLLVELSEKLGFSELGAGSWAAYSDRLWDLQTAEGESPVAIILGGLDMLLGLDLHSFVRCIHNLLSMTEAVGLADARNDL